MCGIYYMISQPVQCIVTVYLKRLTNVTQISFNKMKVGICIDLFISSNILFRATLINGRYIFGSIYGNSKMYFI